MTPAAATTLTTTQRVGYRVHRRTADPWAATQVSIGTGFSNTAVLMVKIADLAHGRPALDPHLAHLTGWHHQCRPVPFASSR